MKNLMIVLVSLLAASAADAGSCKTFRDSCIKKGVSRAHDGITQCEWEEANAAKDQACISKLQRRYYRRHKGESKPDSNATNSAH